MLLRKIGWRFIIFIDTCSSGMKFMRQCKWYVCDILRYKTKAVNQKYTAGYNLCIPPNAMQVNPNRQSRWYFGGLASAGAACITHPLDLLKVHLQTGDGSKTNTGLIGHVSKVCVFWNKNQLKDNSIDIIIRQWLLVIFYITLFLDN